MTKLRKQRKNLSAGCTQNTPRSHSKQVDHLVSCYARVFFCKVLTVTYQYCYIPVQLRLSDWQLPSINCPVTRLICLFTHEAVPKATFPGAHYAYGLYGFVGSLQGPGIRNALVGPACPTAFSI